MSIYTCLKGAHKSSNSVLPLFSRAEGCYSSSCMYKYWMLIMKFQIIVFIRSMREGNFKLFVKILISLVKWVFIFDYYNYARWLSVHIQDLLSLIITCSQLYQEFERESLVVQISGRQFSQIHHDQAHKQSNKTIKSVKGPVDLWIVQAMSYRKVGDRRVRNCRIFRSNREQNTQRY